MSGPIAIEICVGDVESAIAAEAGGADRVELCDNLGVGGTTPSIGAIAEACRWLSLPLHVLIRPRAGDFVYSERELAVMRRDIEAAKALGASGVVFGLLDEHGQVDRDRTAAMIALARPLSVTFHKAIDAARDAIEAFDAILDIGVDRVLTSGGHPTALEGCETLRNLVDRSSGRVAVMAGGQLSVDHLGTVIGRSGVTEIHLGSAAHRVDASWSRTDALKVKSIVEAVRGRGEAVND